MPFFMLCLCYIIFGLAINEKTMFTRMLFLLRCLQNDCVCSQDDKGQQYDLTPLAKLTGNWVVVDTRDGHSDIHYHINVCRPVNPTDDFVCPGKFVVYGCVCEGLYGAVWSI